MTLLNLVVILLVIAVVGFAAYLIIKKFFSEPLQTPALAVVGVILLFFLISQFFPGAASFHVWR